MRQLPLRLDELPNIGPAMVADFRLLHIFTPQDLQGKDAYDLYRVLCEKTKTRHDPCVLDTFLAAVDYVGGAPKRPWWAYTKARKAYLEKHPLSLNLK